MYVDQHAVGTVVGTHISEGHLSVFLLVVTPCCSLHSWSWEYMLFLNIDTKLPDCIVITQVTTVW